KLVPHKISKPNRLYQRRPTVHGAIWDRKESLRGGRACHPIRVRPARVSLRLRSDALSRRERKKTERLRPGKIRLLLLRPIHLLPRRIRPFADDDADTDRAGPLCAAQRDRPRRPALFYQRAAPRSYGYRAR